MGLREGKGLLSHPKLAFVTANFQRLSLAVWQYPAWPAQYTRSTRSSFCILLDSALYFDFSPGPPAIPTQTSTLRQMATAEPDKTLDQTAPSTAAPATPPQPSLDKPADATPNGASTQPAIVVPQVNVNGEPLRSPRPSGTFAPSFDPDSATWGANFWVTLIDPQVRHVVLHPGDDQHKYHCASLRPARRSLHVQRQVRLAGTPRWAPLCELYRCTFQIALLSCIFQPPSQRGWRVVGA